MNVGVYTYLYTCMRALFQCNGRVKAMPGKKSNTRNPQERKIYQSSVEWYGIKSGVNHTPQASSPNLLELKMENQREWITDVTKGHRRVSVHMLPSNKQKIMMITAECIT